MPLKPSTAEVIPSSSYRRIKHKNTFIFRRISKLTPASVTSAMMMMMVTAWSLHLGIMLSVLGSARINKADNDSTNNGIAYVMMAHIYILVFLDLGILTPFYGSPKVLGLAKNTTNAIHSSGKVKLQTLYTKLLSDSIFKCAGSSSGLSYILSVSLKDLILMLSF
uniref:Uncharacterized protein n=1 Tax=Opuntia streptacantha TaxID=393608 RepID=A0A7C9DFG5_OPUST